MFTFSVMINEVYFRVNICCINYVTQSYTESLYIFTYNNSPHFRHLHRKFKSQLSNIFSSFITLKNSPFRRNVMRKERTRPFSIFEKLLADCMRTLLAPPCFLSSRGVRNRMQIRKHGSLSLPFPPFTRGE